MDSLGREYSGDHINETMEAHLAYLKLVNVPSLFDVGCYQSNPQSDYLVLNMMDSITHKVVKQNFLAKKEGRKFSDVEKLRQQLQAIHTNMQVGSVLIRFDVSEPLHLQAQPNASKYHLTIDGVPLQTIVSQGKRAQPVQELLIQRIAVSRVIKSDMMQASVPIMTFLPLKEGPLKNQDFLQQSTK
uniref:Uncharacterized protein n=1 Tax=Strombidium rassoulzadegani TaxID=1082188 RepID=A0A7S3FYA7_9SPIT|mmetsp:Transcript_6215/g.10559  ORF Transcript_6215/g.10559 Transcript_6215/m.10559 type:complete len:186 (+) Transcript_6215:361-918(+)